MKNNNVKEESGKSKAETNYLATRAAEAKKQAKAARQRARAAKAKFKAARKAFKQARKVAKQARKEAKVLAKALKSQAKPVQKTAIKKAQPQRGPQAKPEQHRLSAPRIVIEKSTTTGALVRPDAPATPESGRAQTPKVGT